MLEANRNKNIILHTYSEVDSVDGFIGNYKVVVRKKARYVKETLCNGCGACFPVCPAIGPNEFDEGTGPRNAIYRAFAQAVPNVATIDMKRCIKCGLCQKACDQNAIDFDMKDELVPLDVGVIIVATGWKEYEPETGYLGYNKFENVITQMKLERLLAPNGPLVGHVKRPSDGTRPKRILFIQCVGSRDINRNPWCSAGICCLISLKNGKLIKSEYPDSEITIAYIDIRTPGKYYEEYYLRARQAGLKLIKSNVTRIVEDKATKNLKVMLQDSLSDNREVQLMEFDMVVLSAAMVPAAGTVELANKLRVELSPDGFFKEYHPRLNTVDTKVPGIMLSGCSQGPKSISETIMSSKGAASTGAKLMHNKEYVIDMIIAVNEPAKCSRCGICERVCPVKAIEVKPEGAIVDDIRCVGCGLCASLCPSGAMTVRYYRDSQYQQLIDAFLDPFMPCELEDSTEAK